MYSNVIDCPPKTKTPTVSDWGVIIINPAVPYSHMGKPHTTIGATAFYF